MCYCSRNPLQVYTDGQNNYAHCKDCGKTWNLSRMIEVKNNATKTLDNQNGLGVS
jgi:tRNA(Ile2) C34 agmatinyltransferase TiaS